MKSLRLILYRQIDKIPFVFFFPCFPDFLFRRIRRSGCAARHKETSSLRTGSRMNSYGGMCRHPLFFSRVGIMGNMLPFVTRHSGRGHFGGDVRRALKRNRRVTGPVLIFSAASGFTLFGSKVFVRGVGTGRSITLTLCPTRRIKTLRRSIRDGRSIVDAIDHATLSARYKKS